MWTRTLATLVSLCVVLAGCVAEDAPLLPGPVVVGVLVGDPDGDGADVVRGAELAVEVVNGSYPEVPLSGLGGGQLRLAVSHTGGDPDAAEAAADELMASGPVAGIVAADDAEVVAVAAAYATRRGVAMVDAATSAGYLLDLGLEWYFRVGPNDQMLAEAVFAMVADSPPGGERAVVLIAGSQEGGGVARLVPPLAGQAGLTVVDTIPVSGAEEVDAVVRLEAAAPDVVVAVAENGAGAGQIRELLSSVEILPPVIELGPGHAERGGDLVGSVRPVVWSGELASRHPLAQAVAGVYEDRYGEPMTGRAAAAFTGVMTLAAAVNAAGSGDPEAVRVALRQLDLPATQLIMLWRGVRFAANGQNGSAAVVVEQRDERGWRVVFPPELATGPVAWPTPPREEVGL